jgi:hypothetical protein
MTFRQVHLRVWGYAPEESWAAATPAHQAAEPLISRNVTS